MVCPNDKLSVTVFITIKKQEDRDVVKQKHNTLLLDSGAQHRKTRLM